MTGKKKKDDNSELSLLSSEDLGEKEVTLKKEESFAQKEKKSEAAVFHLMINSSLLDNVTRMKIILNGRKVGNGNIAVYFQNRAYFTRGGLKKRTVLHELYHHLVSFKGLEMAHGIEEEGANSYAREFLNR